jgi:hypothetical protein
MRRHTTKKQTTLRTRGEGEGGGGGGGGRDVFYRPSFLLLCLVERRRMMVL